MLSEPIAVTLQVIEVLEALDVPYLIGGSFAAAVYGVARLTADADLVADVRFEQVDLLANRLSADSTWMLNRCARLFGNAAVSV